MIQSQYHSPFSLCLCDTKTNRLSDLVELLTTLRGAKSEVYEHESKL